MGIVYYYNDLGTPYDYNSIVHYPSKITSNTTNQTTFFLEALNNGTISPIEQLTDIDVEEVRKLYKCHESKKA